ncbi:MAG: DUF4139 domain-containing protein [Desulfovibrio sp.]|jgi:uncharacterized protein (TIGR02231 family)|nr:DUF4139 domain-containing protein [Desulfovibrio sp.]
MKRILPSALCLIQLFAGAAFAAARPPARPVSALFYPNQVQATVEERLPPETIAGLGRGFLLTLPAAAGQASFSASVDGLPASGFSWPDPETDLPPQRAGAPSGNLLPSSQTPATRPEEETDPDRRALLQTLVTLRDKTDALTANLDTLDLRLRLWRIRDKENSQIKAEERLKLDAAFKDILPDLFKAKSSGERLRDDQLILLQEAENALRNYDRKHGRRFVFIPTETQDNKISLLRYSYTLPGSWRAFYDLNAFPGKDSLTIAQSASLLQSSGFAWKNVEVFISTSGPDTNPDPLPLPPWHIRLAAITAAGTAEAAPETPRPRNLARQQRSTAQIAAVQSSLSLAEEPDALLAPPREGAAAAEEEKGVFRLWNLGRRDIESGIATTVPLASNEYPAQFHYTLRPALNPKGFLSASLSLKEALELPPGQARFFVDTVFVGERRLSLNGRSALLHFGADPQVVATRLDQKHVTGEQGFLDKEQTVLWHWDFLVRNTRNRPVLAWVEDPSPQIRDSAITVRISSTPPPEEASLDPRQGGTKIYRWKLSLQPGESRTISHKVTVLAPADKPLDPGREE